jgi:RNA processing factor Prp31
MILLYDLILLYFTDFAEMNRVVSEHERVIETLQLFPLNSFDHESDQKLRRRTNECKEITTAFSYNIGTEMEHPPLDLRLSFL